MDIYVKGWEGTAKNLQLLNSVELYTKKKRPTMGDCRSDSVGIAFVYNDFFLH